MLGGDVDAKQTGEQAESVAGTDHGRLPLGLSLPGFQRRRRADEQDDRADALEVEPRPAGRIRFRAVGVHHQDVQRRVMFDDVAERAVTDRGGRDLDARPALLGERGSERPGYRTIGADIHESAVGNFGERSPEDDVLAVACVRPKGVLRHPSSLEPRACGSGQAAGAPRPSVGPVRGRRRSRLPYALRGFSLSRQPHWPANGIFEGEGMTEGPDVLPAAGAAFTAAAFETLVRAERVAWGSDAERPLSLGSLVAAPDLADAWAYGLYAAVLHRLPDDDGLDAHVAALRAGADPAELRRAMLASDEATQREAAADEFAYDHEADAEADADEAVQSEADESDQLNIVFVTGAYLVALGRTPDIAGLDTHIDLLEHGTSRRAVLDGLVRSPEAKQAARFPQPRNRPMRTLVNSLQARRRARRGERPRDEGGR